MKKEQQQAAAVDTRKKMSAACIFVLKHGNASDACPPSSGWNPSSSTKEER
jgi:hypothetical protein